MLIRQLIGVYQIITGIFGAVLIFSNIGKIFEHSELGFTFFIGIILFAGVIYSGYALLKEINNAVKYSIIAQALQSISIIYNGTQYLFTASAFVSLIIKSGSLKMNYQVMPISYNISEISSSIPFELKVYIVPVIFILLLLIKK